MPWQKTKAEVKFPFRTLCALPRPLFLRSNINLVPRARKCWLWIRDCSNIRWITEAGSLGFLDQSIESCVNWRMRSQTKIRGGWSEFTFADNLYVTSHPYETPGPRAAGKKQEYKQKYLFSSTSMSKFPVHKT